jgi:hypothetical protein
VNLNSRSFLRKLESPPSGGEGAKGGYIR